MSNHDLLLVIDLQNVYTEGQPWACCHIRQAARNIRRLLDAGVCGEVLFTRFVPPAQPEGMWREYNRVNAAVNADAFANAMLPEMAPYLERYPLLGMAERAAGPGRKPIISTATWRVALKPPA